MKNYYTILEVERKATKAQINVAFKKKSVKYHPDKNNGQEFFTEFFKDINEARQILIDDEKRAEYDKELDDTLFPASSHGEAKGNNMPNQIFAPFRLKFRTLSFALLIIIVGFFSLILILFNSDDTEGWSETLGLNKVQSEVIKVQNAADVKQPLTSNAPEQSSKIAIGNVVKSDVLRENRVSKLTGQKLLKNFQEQDFKKVFSGLKQSSGFSENQLLMGSIYSTAHRHLEVPLQKKIETSLAPQKLMSEDEMTEVYNLLKERDTANNNINCVKVLKTKSSNVKNAFELAAFLKDKGIVIAGRESVNKNQKGTAFEVSNNCLIVTIGDY